MIAITIPNSLWQDFRTLQEGGYILFTHEVSILFILTQRNYNPSHNPKETTPKHFYVSTTDYV